jgi:hypothetical protein
MGEDWVAQRLKERNRAKGQSAAIRAGTGLLWQNFWAAIDRALRAYNDSQPKELAIRTTDLGDNMQVTLTARDAVSVDVGRKLNVLELRLDRETQSIHYAYETPVRGMKRGLLGIGVNGDQQVCFIDESGNAVSIESAVRKILDPFLFSDLPELPSLSF